MTTYTLWIHPELNDISECDKNKLIEVIKQYNAWYIRHVDDSHRKHEIRTSGHM
jgi:hypothetical protein